MTKDNFKLKQIHEDIYDLFFKDKKFGSIGLFPDKTCCLTMFETIMYVKDLKDGLVVAKRLYWPLYEAKKREAAFDRMFNL